MNKDFLDSLKNWVLQYGLLVVSTVLAVFVIGSLVTFDPTDPSWFYYSNHVGKVHNVFGTLGAHLSAWLIYLFGSGAYLFIPVFLYLGYIVIRKISFKVEWDRFLGIVVGFFTFTTFLQIHQIGSYKFSYPGGVVGRYLTAQLLSGFDPFVKQLVVFSMLVVSMILVTRFAFLVVAQKVAQLLEYVFQKDSIPAKMIAFSYNMIVGVCRFVIRQFIAVWSLVSGKVIKSIGISIVEFEQERKVDEDIDNVVQDLFWDDYLQKNKGQQVEAEDEESFLEFEEHFEEEHVQNIVVEEAPVQHEMFARKTTPVKKSYKLPFVAPAAVNPVDEQLQQEKLKSQAHVLEEKLEQFGIQGKVVGMHPGPVVVLFEYRPDIKVKVSRILALEDDLAMALQALSIRIIAPIPGRSVVGFEVANKDRQDVMFDKILNSKSFKDGGQTLPLILGEDTLGNDVVSDLAKMPHLLIAGSTGSGKSVALNAMLVSLLCARGPEELKLIIIDPKRLEFSAYEDIAHLLFPIITDTKKAVPILKWVVKTMEQRYETMAEKGARNIFDYQKLVENNPDLEPMPLIVVMIDELADLMMTAGKAVEDSLARIAQMARAAGIHMIVATQRPSVDVITGMIKVNFPNRISFKVTSKIDSRTILDAGGAEKLLGRGDMLFLDAASSHLVRVHGAYVSDNQIKAIVQQIKSQETVSYLDITEFFAQQEDSSAMDGDDELYQEILELLEDVDEVSISMLQRRFRIGYNRSARIIEMLESKGLIMPADGGKMRRVVKQ